MIGPAEFVDTVFAPKAGHAVCITHPDSFVNDAGKTVNYFRNYTHREVLFTKPNSWYVCVSTVTAVPRGMKITRKIEDLQEAMVLVLDDVGTKSAVPPVAPSYILETSKGNYQYGYILTPHDVSTPEGYALYDGSLRALGRAGLNDPGAVGGYRAVRVPGSIHKTGWVCRCTLWEPDRCWDLEELMAQMGVEPLKQRGYRSPGIPGDPDRSVGITTDPMQTDPIYAFMVEKGLALSPLISGKLWIEIECINAKAHTTGSSIAYYSPAGWEDENASYSCLHAHCTGIHIKDYEQFIIAQGGPVRPRMVPAYRPHLQNYTTQVNYLKRVRNPIGDTPND